MRKYILVALVLVVLGIGVSLLLIPSEDEVVQLQARDEVQVDLGNIDVEAEYQQGRRSFPIVSGVVDKKIAAGDSAGAIKILEEYVAATPDDVNARKKLAEQYRKAGDSKKYNEQREAIAAADPSEQNIKLLSDIYNAEKNYKKQIEMLQKLIEVTQGAKPEYYADLATIQMIENQSAEALETIKAMRQAHPDFKNYSATRIYISALSKKGSVDEAAAEAEAWMVANPADAKHLGDLVNILHYVGKSAEAALALVDSRVDLLAQDVVLTRAYVNASITAGRDERVYTLLGEIAATGAMPPELYSAYLGLAIKRDDATKAKEIAAALDPLAFSEIQALDLIDQARASQNEAILSAILSRFASNKSQPILAAVVGILTDSKEQDALITTALSADLSEAQRNRLAGACARAEKMACFDSIVKQYPSVAEMTPVQLAKFARLHIVANRAESIVDAVALRAAKDSAPEVQYAYLKLAASAGRADIMQAWLTKNAETAPVDDLQDYFYLANENKHAAITSQIAEALYARDPSPENRNIMITALLSAGEHDKALGLLRTQITAEGASDGLYLSTLSGLARKDAKYKKELVDYAQAALEAGRGDAKQQLNYAYILINNGKRSEALVVAREKAKTGAPEWKKMVAQLSPAPRRGGASGGKAVARKPLTAEQKIAMANAPGASIATKRQIAFDLLKTGPRDAAERLFVEMARDKGPESKEVKELLYVWGGKLSGAKLTWVTDRARAANAYDRGKWADLVISRADDVDILRYASSAPDALHHAPLRKRFFSVLAQERTAAQFDAGMRPWVDQTSDPDALHDYAQVAMNFGYKDAARYTYERILAIDPNNKRALNQVGAMDYVSGRYSRSKELLDKAVTVPSQDASAQTLSSDSQAHYFRANLLKREGKLEEARQEYANVVQMAQQSLMAGQNLPADSRTRLYTSLFHLGRAEEGKRGFEQMLQNDPHNKSILADYMSILIEFNMLEDATRAANQYDKNSVYNQQGSYLNGNSPHVSQVEQFSGGREMKISFAKPLDGKSPLNTHDDGDYAWLESQQVGYDSVSVSAKPGYVLRYIPTAATEFAVVPAAATQLSEEQISARKQDLRLQLLYAQIEQKTGQRTRARERLAALSGYYPQEPQLMLSQANIENRNGNPIGALELIQQAQALSPDNEGIAELEREVRRTQKTNFVKIDHEWRSLGKNNEQITTLSGATRITQRSEIGFNLKNDSMESENIRDAETGRIGDYDTSRQQGELFAAYYFEDGGRAQASVFANNDSAGFGAYYAFNNGFGRSEVFGEFHRPYWGFVEAVYEDTTRNRMGLRHNASVGEDTSLSLEGSLNQYNTRVEDNIAQSGLLRANVVHTVRKAQPNIALGYGFAADYYYGNQDTRTDNFGNDYELLNLGSLEVHSATISMSHKLTDSTRAGLITGWYYDRLNDTDGPVIEGRLTQDLSEDVEAGVRARYGRQSNDSDNNATQVGAHMQMKF